MASVSRTYASNLSDKEWGAIEALIPFPKMGGRKAFVDTRAVINAILYLMRTGCSWRLLPNDFPHWRTSYGYFKEWQQDGTWYRIDSTLSGISHYRYGRKNLWNPNRKQ